MAKMKKVILFLVEGITDKVSLEGVLSELIETKEVAFQITQGDVTSDKNSKPENILTRITDYD